MSDDEIAIKVHKDNHKIVIIKDKDDFAIGVVQLDDNNLATIRNVYLNSEDLKKLQYIFKIIDDSLKEETNG